MPTHEWPRRSCALHLRMNASGEKMRRMRMPQIAKPDVRAGPLALASSRTNSWVRLFGEEAARRAAPRREFGP